MSETEGNGQEFPPGDGAAELPEPRAPRRVIATPPPAKPRPLLEPPPAEEPPAPRELPAEPDNLPQANRAARVVAALFLLSMLASIGFIAAYIGLEVGSGGR